jgi:diguanylate cyclase (GGDEF)-like protein/PAS domain S-box-containing protein
VKYIQHRIEWPVINESFFVAVRVTIVRSKKFRLIHSISSKTKGMRYLTVLFMLILSHSAVGTEEFKEFFPVQYHSAETALQLTKAEQKWLKGHKNIRVAFDGSLPPYSFINEQGKVDGIAFEMITILSQRLGFNFSIHTDSDWSELYRTAVMGKVDMVATMVNRPGRVERFKFTKPYITKSLVIITKQDNTTIKSRSDLNHKKIAVAQGYHYGEQLGQEFPDSIRVNVKNMLETLIKVDKGEVDAAILFLGTANYLQAQHHLTHLKIAGFYDRKSADESIAVRKDWPMLAGILQKGLDSLTEGEVQKIFNKWVVQSGVSPISQKTEKTGESAQPVIQKNIETETKPEIPVDKTAKVYTSKESNPSQQNAGIFLGILALTILSFFYLRKQIKKKSEINTTNKASNKNTDSVRAENPKLSIVSSIEIGNAEPSAELPSEQPILVNTEQLNTNTDYSSDVIVKYQRDAEGRFISISPAITSLLGYSETDFKVNFRRFLTDNPVNQNLDGYLDACLEGKPIEAYEVEIYDVAHKIHWLEFREAAVYDGQGHCLTIEGELRDISSQKYYQKMMAATSSEAALQNQQFLRNGLELAIERAAGAEKTFALIFLWLERLRFLDGSLIIDSGAEVLTEASKRLIATLRETDTVIELATDKFALIMPEIDDHTATLIVDKIRKILQVPYLVELKSIVLDANFGIAFYPEHGLNYESLIRQTQKLLLRNQSDSTSLNQVHEFAGQAADSLRLQHDLVSALDECKVTLRALSPHNINALHRHSQFSIHYQSRHNLQDFAITGFEALIRWQHPELGLLMAKDFVGLVKDIGLLDVLTYWIIQQVSFQAVAWERQNVRPRFMAINLGGLANDKTVEVAKIVKIISETGARAEWFVFSITEIDVSDNQALVIPIVNQFVEANFTVAIDNYRSDRFMLALLKKIPAEIIEIDPILISNFPVNAPNAKVEASNIAKLHGLGKTVVAKGVETEQQLKFLKKIGCDLVQGHLLSKPVPASEAKDLMKNLPDFASYLKK